MNKFEEIEKLKKIMKLSLCNDEYETICYYIDEYKRLKTKELKELEVKKNE